MIDAALWGWVLYIHGTYSFFSLYPLTLHLMIPTAMGAVPHHALASLVIRTSRIRNPDKTFLKLSVRCVTTVRRENNTGAKPEP